MPELFETPYFCIEQDVRHLALAQPLEENRAVKHFEGIARELGVVLPISFFERAGRAYTTPSRLSMRMGACSGPIANRISPTARDIRRRITSAPATRLQSLGYALRAHRRGHLWDQWFPETSRAMALMGAELLFFPTAIGSEPPPALPLNSREHWQRTQQGHAAANLTPLIASNRYGMERSIQNPDGLCISFYGSSFIADATGAKIAEAGEQGDAVLTATFDLDALAQQRDNWFVFRDRRPELYGPLLTLDGRQVQGRS